MFDKVIDKIKSENTCINKKYKLGGKKILICFAKIFTFIAMTVSVGMLISMLAAIVFMYLLNNLAWAKNSINAVLICWIVLCVSSVILFVGDLLNKKKLRKNKEAKNEKKNMIIKVFEDEGIDIYNIEENEKWLEAIDIQKSGYRERIILFNKWVPIITLIVSNGFSIFGILFNRHKLTDYILVSVWMLT